MARRNVCNVPGCATISDQPRCTEHRRQADRLRGSATQRGYTSRGHLAFRSAVLRRDPICVICHLAVSTIADHFPISRRDLIEQGLNPNDPQHGRGLCASCHGSETARHQPGGWNAGNYYG
jgi:5-methylcytosine-specific restriction protein A